MKVFLAFSALLLTAPSASAQDMPGAVDLPTLAHGQVVSAAVRAQGRSVARRGHRGSRMTEEQRAAANCVTIPSLRKRYAAQNPDIQRLAQMCGQAGY